MMNLKKHEVRGMRYVFIFLALTSYLLPPTCHASTVISGTISITNATSGQSYTLNGDTRTFTNSVASAATQIRVRTNDSAATILLSLVGQAGSYPFTGIQSMTTSAGTNVTFRATNDTALTITLSPTNYGKVSYSTQTVGTVQTVVRVPISAEDSSAQTNIINGLMNALNSSANTNKISSDKLDAASTIAVGGTNVSPANLANSASVTWARVGSNITATASLTGGLSGVEAGYLALTNSEATVASANVATNSLIFLARMGSGDAVAVSENLQARSLATSFQIVSAGTNDSALVAWQIFNTGPEVPILSTNYLAPYAYFRMDSTNTDFMTDEVAGQDWVKLISAAVSTNDSIISNAFYFPASNVTYGTNNNFDFADQDFALRFWVKKSGTSNNSFFFDQNDATDVYMVGAATNAIRFEETTDAGGSTTFTNTSLYPISTNVWHRVIVWREGTSIGIKVDNNSRETTTISGAADFSNIRFRNNSSDNVLYDEIAIWLGYVPTESEMRWDWNSGAGRTYPLGP